MLREGAESSCPSYSATQAAIFRLGKGKQERRSRVPSTVFKGSAQGPGGARGCGWALTGAQRSGKQGPICALLSERRSLTDKSIFSPSAVRSVSRLSSECCFMQQGVAFDFRYSVTLPFRY